MSTTWAMTRDDVQRVATVAVESYLKALEDEGLLKQSAESIQVQYSIIVFEKGWFSKFFDSFFKTQGDGAWNFRTVKHIIHTKKNATEPSPDDREGNIISILEHSKNKNKD